MPLKLIGNEHSLCIKRKCVNILHRKVQLRIALYCNVILIFGMLVRYIIYVGVITFIAFGGSKRSLFFFFLSGLG